jgi:hypothetical protein
MVVLLVLGAGTVATATSKPVAEPTLRLVAMADAPVVLERAPGAWVWLELGTYLVAGRQPLELRARRGGYDQPITIHELVGGGPGRRQVRLPDGLASDFAKFTRFTHVTVTDAAGATVAEQDEPWCPGGAPSYASAGKAARVDAGAPATTHYPWGCPRHPFALGAVWGLQAGWGAPSTSAWYDAEPVDLADGDYTAEVRVNQPYRGLFHIPASRASVTVAFSVRTTPDGAAAAAAPAARPGAAPSAAAAILDSVLASRRLAGHPASHLAGHPAGHGISGQHAHGHMAADPSAGPGQPAALNLDAPPTAAASPGQQPARTDGRQGRFKPDLRALPAWFIGLDTSGPQEMLTFAATIWVAGKSPLAVKGTRRPGTELMDAVQHFYDPDGHQTGTAPAGTFEWDPRPGHVHWHFTDFAAYRLLDADGTEVAPSHKQAFCLSNSHDIDTTIAQAPWQPALFEQDPACGQADAQTLSQWMDVGWGDTYVQDLPGQAIDVTGVPNGTYQLEIVANPSGRLHESDMSNNSVRREVTLEGDPGARFVLVPPYQGIDF